MVHAATGFRGRWMAVAAPLGARVDLEVVSWRRSEVQTRARKMEKRRATGDSC